MGRMCWIIAAFAWTAIATSLQGKQEEIVVHLQTEGHLTPLYLTHIRAEQTSLSQPYINQLEAILRFDFEHNGTTRLLDSSSEREALAQATDAQPGQLAPQWKQAGISYLLIPRLQEMEASVRLFVIGSSAVKEIKGVALTGELAHDRQQIHRLSDSLHKEMTGVGGIATTHLLYTLRTKGQGNEWTSEVWTSDYDGGNARRVTRAGDYCITPTFVPPKTGHAAGQFLYVSYGSGQPRIFLSSLKDGQPRRLTSAKGNQLMPTLSRQRDLLALICDVTGSPDLFLQSYDPETGKTGKLQLLYSAHGATQSTPTLSPDGREIAFTSDKDGRPRIYRLPIPPPGTHPKALKPNLVSKRATNGSAPAWSPDGTKIAFSAETQGTRQIWLYDCLNEEEMQITFGSGHKENAAWAPDSLHLIYNTASSNNNELYIVDLNRMTPWKVATHSGEKRFPSWGP